MHRGPVSRILLRWVAPTPMTIRLGCLLPDTSSCQPGSARGKTPLWPRPRAIPIWHCSRWGLPCRCCCQPRGGLLPHRFTLTLTDQGSLFSVALSLGLPRPGVTRHRCLVESGLSSRACAPAAIQPSVQALPYGVTTTSSTILTCQVDAALRQMGLKSSETSSPSAHGRNRSRTAANSVSSATSPL